MREGSLRCWELTHVRLAQQLPDGWQGPRRRSNGLRPTRVHLRRRHARHRQRLRAEQTPRSGLTIAKRTQVQKLRTGKRWPEKLAVEDSSDPLWG